MTNALSMSTCLGIHATNTKPLPGVDLAPIYPEAFKPQFITTLREFYIATYADRFFTQPPAWFNMYMYMELIYHVPLSVWAIGALIRGMLLLFVLC